MNAFIKSSEKALVKNTNLKNEILLIPDKSDEERDRLAEVWESRGGAVKRIGKFWVKPEVGDKRVSVYGYDSFCLVLAQILEFQLMMPRDEIIAELQWEFVKRKIEIENVSEIEGLTFPWFLKPVIPKLFRAEIFTSLEDLREKIQGIGNQEKLICSELITVDKEVRSFILDGEIIDLAYYEGEGELESPTVFIDRFLKECRIELPRTFVLDVGYNGKDGWFVIEFNSSWGAGLNSCDPEKVVVCIREACVPVGA